MIRVRAVAILLAVVLYILLPADLLPDFAPLVGWLDDILVAAVGLWLVLRRRPR